jgi:hypothetical protein
MGEQTTLRRSAISLQVQVRDSAGTPKDVVVFVMTTLLDRGIQAVRELPADRQDLAGKLLLTLAATTPRYELTAEQIEDLRLSIAQADRGEFATEEEVAKPWKKFGP